MEFENDEETWTRSGRFIARDVDQNVDGCSECQRESRETYMDQVRADLAIEKTTLSGHTLLSCP